MQIDSPTWTLRGIRCECCSGQGALCFSACPSCRAVALVCDEVGTVYLDPHNLEHAVYGGLEDPNCQCVRCGKQPLSTFVNATTEEIEAAGFVPGTYE